MKKFLTLCAVLLTIAFTMRANLITADDAQQLAQSFLSSQSMMRHTPGAAASQQQLTLQATLAGCYVFQRQPDDGFVIVAGDDAATQPILGYADTGSIDTDNMPCSLRWMLEEYGRELAWAREHAPTADTQTVQPKATMVTRTAIAPLVQSYWAQGLPYNALCPTLDDGRCVTGCVATATAQIMRYHQHPALGKGSHYYTWNNRSLGRDFSESTYDWNNMLLDYASAHTEAQDQAVARLMADVGIAVDMEYGSDESAASTANVPRALTTYFGYSPTAHEVARAHYGLTAWINLLQRTSSPSARLHQRFQFRDRSRLRARRLRVRLFPHQLGMGR